MSTQVDCAITGGALDRFLSRLKRTDSGCLEWQGPRKETGYGRMQVGDRRMRTHRIAWELWRGEIPEGMSVCHKCDNPPCCNPDHLFLGSHADNMADAAKKGRFYGRPTNPARGEACGLSRLSERQVIEIRELAARGDLSIRGIARLYGVSHSTVRDILNRVTWTHI